MGKNAVRHCGDDDATGILVTSLVVFIMVASVEFVAVMLSPCHNVADEIYVVLSLLNSLYTVDHYGSIGVPVGPRRHNSK